MTEKGRNIYKTAREQAGMTQEQAAEALNVSVKSIACYEAEERYPNNDIANAMVKVYDNQFLAVQHIQLTAKGISKNIVPNIERMGLPTSVLVFLKELEELNKCTSSLIAIAADGTVDDSEKTEYDRILKEMDDVVRAIYMVRFAEK